MSWSVLLGATQIETARLEEACYHIVRKLISHVMDVLDDHYFCSSIGSISSDSKKGSVY